VDGESTELGKGIEEKIEFDVVVVLVVEIGVELVESIDEAAVGEDGDASEVDREELEPDEIGCNCHPMGSCQYSP
jgi:hypothetical protein